MFSYRKINPVVSRVYDNKQTFKIRRLIYSSNWYFLFKYNRFLAWKHFIVVINILLPLTHGICISSNATQLVEAQSVKTIEASRTIFYRKHNLRNKKDIGLFIICHTSEPNAWPRRSL